MTVSVKQALLGYASLTRERRFFFSERNISELSPTLNHRTWLPSVDLPHRTGTPRASNSHNVESFHRCPTQSLAPKT